MVATAAFAPCGCGAGSGSFIELELLRLGLRLTEWDALVLRLADCDMSVTTKRGKVHRIDNNNNKKEVVAQRCREGGKKNE